MESSTLCRGDTQSPLTLTPPPHLTYLGVSNHRAIMVYDRKYDKNDGIKDLGSVVTLVSSSKWPTWPTRSLRPQGLHEKSFSGARKPSKGEDEGLVHHT